MVGHDLLGALLNDVDLHDASSENGEFVDRGRRLLLGGRRLVDVPRAHVIRHDLLRTVLNDLDFHDSLLTDVSEP